MDVIDQLVVPAVLPVVAFSRVPFEDGGLAPKQVKKKKSACPE
jgi:hypothetical protein